MTVTVRRLGEMGRIIDTLVGVGANEVNGPNFTLDEPRAAQDEARVEAIATGRQRAELYARAAGDAGRADRLDQRERRLLSGRADRRHRPRIGGFAGAPPPPPPAPVMPGELQIGVNVSMQFELVR